MLHIKLFAQIFMRSWDVREGGRPDGNATIHQRGNRYILKLKCNWLISQSRNRYSNGIGLIEQLSALC